MKAHEETRLEKHAKEGAFGRAAELGQFRRLGRLQLAAAWALFNAVRVDAGERAKAKAVLERQELRLRRVVDSNVIGIVFADSDRPA